MKLHIASDLHLEWHLDDGVSFLKSFVNPGADALILAGDIFSANSQEQPGVVFSTLAPRYKYVLYVPGNHEAYGTSIIRSWANIVQAASRFKNVYALQNYRIELDGVSFYGGTGWFKRPVDPVTQNAKRLMGDFTEIADLDPCAYTLNGRFAKYLDQTDVIISHHLPTADCVSLRFRGSALNPFFVGDLWDESIDCKLWVFGHTHDPVDIPATTTSPRFLANPLGYPFETNRSFRRQLIVEV